MTIVTCWWLYISLFCVAFPQHGHWRPCTVFFVKILHTHLFIT